MSSLINLNKQISYYILLFFIVVIFLLSINFSLSSLIKNFKNILNIFKKNKNISGTYENKSLDIYKSEEKNKETRIQENFIFENKSGEWQEGRESVPTVLPLKVGETAFLTTPHGVTKVIKGLRRVHVGWWS